MSRKKFYEVGGVRGTGKEFAERAWVSIETMRQRLYKFANGKYPEEKLLDGICEANLGGGNSSWKGLSEWPRTENLQRIQPPTRFDEMFAGK